MPAPPHLIYSLLIPCETVLFEEGGTASAIRILDAVTVQEDEATVGLVEILFALRFEAGYDPVGQEFSVDVTNPAGVTEMLMKPSAVNFVKPTELHPAVRVGTNIKVALEIMERHTGIYRLRGYLNGQEVATASIALVQPKPERNTR